MARWGMMIDFRSVSQCRASGPTALFGLCVAAALTVAGCTAISIAPSCPEELTVGESGPIEANQHDEGGIPTYLWEVFPATAGTVAAPAAPSTTFTAAEEGIATLRLTASDGLYQMIAECTTNVVAADDTTDGNDNDNSNGNDNDNDNSNVNDNDNGDDQPPVRR